MFNVYGKGFINDKPVDLNTAIKLAKVRSTYQMMMRSAAGLI